MNVTGGESTLCDVFELLKAVCGDEFNAGRGRKGYEKGNYWPNGVELSTHGRSGRWWLQLTGSACRALGFEAVMVIGRRAMMGGKCTRLDICRDWIGEPSDFISRVTAACHSGWLRSARSFQPVITYQDDTNTKTGEGIYLGSKASPLFVRLYDKGLEQAAFALGQWLRYEAQLRDDKAHEAACMILSVEAIEDAKPIMLSLLAGSADFREGPREVKPSRLPVPEFWRERWAGLDAVKLRMAPDVAELDTWLEWFRFKAGGLVVKLAGERAGLSSGEMFELIMGECQPNDGTRKNPMVDKLAAWSTLCA
jgi:hypothetical protein